MDKKHGKSPRVIWSGTVIQKKIVRKIRRLRKRYRARVEFVQERNRRQYAEEKVHKRGFLHRR